MQNTQKIRLGDFYELEIGVVYPFCSAVDLKNQLQKLHGVQLTVNYDKNHDESPYSIGCPNFHCPYLVKFNPQYRFYGNLKEPLQVVLKLESYYLHHLESCKNQEDANFLRNKHKISKIKDTLTRTIRNKLYLGELNEKLPQALQIIQKFNQQQNLDPNFYCQGVINPDYKNKLRKMFKNILGRAKERAKQILNIQSPPTNKKKPKKIFGNAESKLSKLRPIIRKNRK